MPWCAYSTCELKEINSKTANIWRSITSFIGKGSKEKTFFTAMP
jgi:hypothetical protein